MSRKILAFLLSLLILCQIIPFGAVAGILPEEGSGNEVEDFPWGDQTVPEPEESDISMLAYEIVDGEVTITDCDESATEVVIPETIEGYPVTNIGDYAFENCHDLTNITIPDSVTSIREDALLDCDNLTIYGYAGSTAEVYATENNIPFITLEDTDITFSENEVPRIHWWEPSAEEKKAYTVTWKNWDGDILEIDNEVEEGIIPIYNSSIPTRQATSQYTYTFAGWSPSISTVTEDTEYIAIFTEIPIYHKVTFKYDNFASDKVITNVMYGDKVDVETDITKYGYTFMGWKIAELDVIISEESFVFNYDRDLTLIAQWHTEATFTIYTSKTVRPGETVEVPISISNSTGYTGVMIEISYADELELVDVTQIREGFSRLDMTVSGDLGAGLVKLIWDSPDADTTNGRVAMLTFKVREDIICGEYDINLTVKMACDENINDVEIQGASSKLEVKAFTPGDANDDGAIDLKDVIIIRRYIVGGYDISYIEEALDVNQDGVTDLKDVIILRRFVVGGYGVEL